MFVLANTCGYETNLFYRSKRYFCCNAPLFTFCLPHQWTGWRADTENIAAVLILSHSFIPCLPFAFSSLWLYTICRIYFIFNQYHFKALVSRIMYRLIRYKVWADNTFCPAIWCICWMQLKFLFCRDASFWRSFEYLYRYFEIHSINWYNKHFDLHFYTPKTHHSMRMLYMQMNRSKGKTKLRTKKIPFHSLQSHRNQRLSFFWLCASYNKIEHKLRHLIRS